MEHNFVLDIKTRRKNTQGARRLQSFKCLVIGISILGRWNGVLYLITWHAWRAPSTMKHEGLQVGSFKMHSFNCNNHYIKSIFVCWFVITHAIMRSWRWWSNTVKVNRWYLCTLVPKVPSMESAPLCPNSNNQAICNGVCMPIVKGKSFVLSFSCKKKTFSWYSKVHICTLMWSLGWCF